MSFTATLKAFALALPLVFGAAAFAQDRGADLINNGDGDYGIEQYGNQDFSERHSRRGARLQVGNRKILSPDAIARRLRQQDYSNVHRIIYTGGIYTAAVREDGREVVLRIDACSGEVMNAGGDFHHARWSGERPVFSRTSRIASEALVTRADVRQALIDKGYEDLGWIREEGTTYVVRARDSNGERVEVTVDRFSAEVIDTAYIS